MSTLVAEECQQHVPQSPAGLRDRPVYRGEAPDLARLGATIRERRKELSLTQTGLADRLGWAQERISTLETGKYGLPSLPLLAHLAQALELSLGVLMEAVGFGLEEQGAVKATSTVESRSGGMQGALNFTLQRLLTIQALTLREAMNRASDLMADAMGADKIDLFIHEPETDTLVVLGASNTDLGRKQKRVGLDRVPVVNGGRQVDVFLTGKEYYTGNAQEDPEISRGIVHTLGVRSMCIVPLRVDGTVSGLLVAESVHQNRFSEAERDFFEAAARWIGMVAHRVELHEKLMRQAAEDTRRQVAEEMLETVAHDLGNRITPIKGQIDLFLRRATRAGSDQDTRPIVQASESLEQLNCMVQELLDASRLEGGIFSLECSPTDVVDLAHQVVQAARVDRQEIEVRTPEVLVANVDPARVTQAVQNLVGNAVQHTPEGVLIVVTVRQETGDDGEWAVIEVHDEGPGITAELLPQLFTRYATGGEAAGAGLGLYLAHGIAVAHGGTLTVQSETGSGTVFTMRLPV